MLENTDKPRPKAKLTSKLKIVDLLRPHWTALSLAFLAVLGETLTDVLEPWPIKIVADNLLQHKRLPGWKRAVKQAVKEAADTADAKDR